MRLRSFAVAAVTVYALLTLVLISASLMTGDPKGGAVLLQLPIAPVLALVGASGGSALLEILPWPITYGLLWVGSAAILWATVAALDWALRLVWRRLHPERAARGP